MATLAYLTLAPSFGERRFTSVNPETIEFNDCPDTPWCPKMVVIAAGKFVMGSAENEIGRFDDEGPQRVVALKAFAASKYVVTFDQYDACVRDGDCRATDDAGWGRGDRPVIKVSWDDARPIRPGSRLKQANHIVCPLRPSGNTRRAAVLRRLFIGGVEPITITPISAQKSVVLV
ncbi:MAG: SUMF1/EgtB/PvdO family nonheme iron enzyme [Alphaproteobacteria bacterium]